MRTMTKQMREIADEMTELNLVRNAPSTSPNDRDMMTDHLTNLEAELSRLF